MNIPKFSPQKKNMTEASSLSSSLPSAAITIAAAGIKRPPPPCSSPPVPQGWTRCHAYLERKHRFCRQQCQGKQWNQTGVAAADYDDNDSTVPRYCGNHQHLFLSSDAIKPTCIGEENSKQSSQPDNCNNYNNNNKNVVNSNKIIKRIPCPIDPTHHIPADKLEKHILVCPKIKRLRAMEKLYYYRHNLNIGGHGHMDDSSSSTSFSSSTTSTTSDATGGIQTQSLERGGIEWAKSVALCVLKVHQQVFSNKHHHYHQQNPDNSSETSSPTASTKKDDHLYCMSYEEIVNALPVQDLSSSSFSSLSQDQPQQQEQQDEKSNLSRAIQAYNIKSGGPKHVHQQASLLGHLRHLGAIPCMSSSSSSSMMTFQPPQQQQQQTQQQQERKRIINILELGAGRGMMGLVAAGVAAAAAAATRTVGNDDDATTTTKTTTRLILVERSGCRSKADRILRNHKNHAGPFNKTSINNKEDNTVTTCTTTNGASSDMTMTVQKTASSSTSTTTTSTTPTTATTSSIPLPSPVIDYMNLQDLEWARMTCDLAHVDMKEVLNHSWSGGGPGGGGDSDPSSTIQQEEQELEQEIHVVAKHLCGVGTDLALKSLQPIRHLISTCLFATCCHGVCSWKDYVGRDYLQSVMIGNNNSNKSNNANNTSNNLMCLSQFGEAEFELLCQWSAGTVATNWSCGGVGGGRKSPQSNQNEMGKEQQTQGNHNDEDDDDNDNEHRTAGSNSNNDAAVGLGVSTIVEALDLKCGVQGLGRACQRLIDYGRLEYMRHVLFINDSSSATTTANSTQLSNEDHQDNVVKLVYYVPPHITPQNAALMGRRR